MSNSQTIQTIANFINQNLPFVLFFLLPFLYNQITGYSVVISLSFSAIFILISIQSWLELRSRFKFQHYLYTRKDQYPKPKITIFNCLETTLGLNFAIIISVLVILNGIALHCMTIKWFFEDITKHLFHFLDENHQHSECTIKNGSQIGNSSDTAHIHDHILFKSNKIVVFVEIVISVLYFIVLIMVDHLSVKYRSKFQHLFSKRKSKFFNILFGIFFISFFLIILSQTLNFNSSRLIIKCEPFFKNSFQSTFSGFGICAAGLFNQLKFDFEERQKKYSTKRKAWKNSSITPKYFLIVIKITSIVLISLSFIFLINLFTPYRNLCCSEFYESFLNHPDHGKHIIKQLCLFFICFYIFYISHKSVKYSGSMLTQIFNTLFNDSSISEAREESSIENDQNESEKIFSSEKFKLKQIYKYFYPCENTVQYFSSFVLSLISFFLLISFTKYDLFIFWTISFLVLNLSIVSSVLLINYFPYQVLVESDTSKAIFFSNKENYPLIRQQLEKQKTKIYNHALKEQREMTEEKEMDDQSIDQIFAEYMGELKIKALSDQDLSFGDKQPSMKSAYRATIGFAIFFACCILYNLVLNFYQVDLKNWLSFFYFLSVLLGLAAVKLVVAILFFFQNTKESIYIKKLNFVSFYLPCNQLLITFFSIFLIFRFNLMQIIAFFFAFLFVLSVLVIYFKFFSILIVKKIQKQILIKNLQMSYQKDSNIFIIN